MKPSSPGTHAVL